jgi:hypothetical protein
MPLAFPYECCAHVSKCQFAGVRLGDDGEKSVAGATGEDGVMAGDDGPKSDGDANGDCVGSGGGGGGCGGNGGSGVGNVGVSENAGT